MLENYIVFSVDDFVYFSNIITKAKELMQDDYIHVKARNNDRFTKTNQSCKTALDTLSKDLHQFILRPPKELKEIKQLGECHRPSFQVCSHILNTLTVLQKTEHPHFREVAGYFCLLASISGVNMLCGIETNSLSDNENNIALFIQRCMEQLEINFLSRISNTHFDNLYTRCVNSLLHFQDKFVSLDKSLPLSHEILQFHVEGRNAYAKKTNSFCECEIVCYPPSRFHIFADPEAIELLVQKIKLLTNCPHSVRKQFLFYYNGLKRNKVELIDVYFNSDEGKIFILNVNSTHHHSQHSFLTQLNIALKKQPFFFKILACQGDFQKEENAALYSYIFSHIASSLPFPQFGEKSYFISQPVFHDLLHTNGSTLPPAENVQWLRFEILGHKAKTIKEWISSFKESLLNCYEKHSWLPTPVAAMQAIQHAAAGFGSIEEFKALLNAYPLEPYLYDELPNKQFPPFNIALKQDQPERALLLIERGVFYNIADENGKTPYDYFHEADPHSQIKQNAVLTKWAKRVHFS